MNRHHKIVKTLSGLCTRKALLNHIIFSPSQTGETVPLISLTIYTKCLPILFCFERQMVLIQAGLFPCVCSPIFYPHSWIIRICFSPFPFFLFVECVALTFSSGGGRSSVCYKKTASVILSAFQRLQDKSPSVCMKKKLHWPSSYHTKTYSRHC
jgi:hypothetical protein